VTDEMGNIPYISHIGFSEGFIKSDKWLSTTSDHCACVRIIAPTLLWHFQKCHAQANLNIDVRHSGLERPFPKDVSIAAYRIVQEALTNILRYAGVCDVWINAWSDENNLYLKIEDKGKGFNANEVSLYTTTGLQGMRERAVLLGGNFTIESSPRIGTRVTAELPRQDNAEELKKMA
jgi:signal transduction histidine kinase